MVIGMLVEGGVAGGNASRGRCMFRNGRRDQRGGKQDRKNESARHSRYRL
jgi:hypothetical protein